MEMTKATRSFVALTAFALVAGCDHSTSSPSLETVKTVVADLTEIVASPSIDSIAHGYVLGIDTLRMDLSLEDKKEFGHIADVAVWNDGRFAVLDRMNHEVSVFAKDGQLNRTFGRKGDGPGEFKDPVAIEAVGRAFVVWDNSKTVFTVFDTADFVLATATAPVDGDWRPASTRASTFRLEYPFDAPWEDLTKRLRAWGDSSFIHQIQIDERAFKRGDTILQKPPVLVLKYSVQAELQDTLWLTHGPPSKPLLGGSYAFQQPVYSSRPLWTSGDRWFARSPPDSGYVDVFLDSGARARIILRGSSATPSMDVLKRNYTNWFIEEDVMRHSSGKHKSHVATLSKRELRKQGRKLTRIIAFAERPAVLTGLYGRGSCIWISGLNAEDAPDGSSLTLLGFELSTMRPHIVRVATRGYRIREVSTAHVYAVARDPDNVLQLKRFVLPETVRCD